MEPPRLTTMRPTSLLSPAGSLQTMLKAKSTWTEVQRGAGRGPGGTPGITFREEVQSELEYASGNAGGVKFTTAWAS
jgi:hypothetical protein